MNIHSNTPNISTILNEAENTHSNRQTSRCSLFFNSFTKGWVTLGKGGCV